MTDRYPSAIDTNGSENELSERMELVWASNNNTDTETLSPPISFTSEHGADSPFCDQIDALTLVPNQSDYILNKAVANFSNPAHINEVGEQEMTSVDSVEFAVRFMDYRYKTNFRSYIQEENNLDVTAGILKRLMMEFDNESLCRVVKWVTIGWSITSTASLVIKLVYSNGITHPDFTFLVNELCVGREWSSTLDLVSTLIIGEDHALTSRFLKGVTHSWSTESRINLICDLSLRSRWTPTFLESVILNITAMDENLDTSTRIATIQFIRQQFKERQDALEHLPLEKTVQLYCSSHRLFSKKVLHVVMKDADGCNQRGENNKESF